MKRTAGSLTRLVAVVALALGSVVGFATVASADPPPWSPAYRGPTTPPDPAIDIIGSWNANLAGELCYSIDVSKLPAGEQNAAAAAMDQAVQDWAEAVNPQSTGGDLVLNADDGSGSTCTPEVTIVTRRGGGTTQGTTSFVSDGPYIAGAQIVIRGRFTSQTNEPATLAHITRHEFGHALGLGHWNVDGHLMSPYLNATTAIDSCESAAVILAQGWHLTDDAGAPSAAYNGPDPYVCTPA